MLFAAVEAAKRLGFAQVSELVAVLISFGAQLLPGLVIIAVGFGILGIVIAMGLRGRWAWPTTSSTWRSRGEGPGEALSAGGGFGGGWLAVRVGA